MTKVIWGTRRNNQIYISLTNYRLCHSVSIGTLLFRCYWFKSFRKIRCWFTFIQTQKI